MKLKHAQKVNALLAAMVLVGGTALAADNTTTATTAEAAYTLPNVVVTATRTPESTLTVPANVSVVTGKQLQQEHYSSLSQAVRDVPGVYVGNYGTGHGFETANALRINGSNNVVYMVDGMSMDAVGVTSPLLAVNNFTGVDKVEVLKGSASALYGSNAVGGVINVITAVPDKGVHTTATISGGSFGTLNYLVSNEGNTGKVFWRATYLNQKQGNYADGAGHDIGQYYKGATGSIMVGANINEDNQIRVYHDQYRSNSRYSGALGTDDPMEPNKLNWDSTRLLWTSHFKGAWDNRLTAQQNRLYQRLGNYDSHYGESTSITDVTTRSLADQLTFTDDYNTVVGGFEWRQDETNSMNHIKLTNMSYYMQDEWKFAPKWTLTPGIRYDHNSAFGNHTSPHVALSYEINPHTTTYVSYNSFFVAPTPYQLYAAHYGNVNLKPETGYTWEWGLHHEFSDTFTGNISYFNRHTTQKIGFDYNTWVYTNIGKEAAQGVSVDLKKKFTDELSGHLDYTYTMVQKNDTQAANVNGIIPKHSILLGLDYAKDKWDAHLNVRAVIDRPGPTTTKGKAFPKSTYYITDVAVNYAATPNITVFGRVNNLFNVYYAEQSNVLYGAPEQWWSAPGRSFEVGTTFKF